MQVLAKSELELPGVVPGGQWLGHRFVIGAHVVNDLVDDDPEPSERFLGSTGQPRQRRKLDARGDKLGVLGGPGHAEAVACGVGDRLAHHCSFNFSIAWSTCRTWYVLALPWSFWMLTRGSPGHEVLKTACESPVFLAALKNSSHTRNKSA